LSQEDTDPVVSAVSGDSHKNSETRRSLQPLVEFASNAGVAVLGVTHYSKGTSGRDPAERVTGSLAFVAVSRLVMATAKPKEPGEPWRLVRAKSNIGPDGGGFEYELRQVPVGAGDGVFGQCVLWGGPLEGTAQALLAEVESPEESSKAPALEAAKLWLREYLGTGTVAAKAIEDVAGQTGHHWATIQILWVGALAEAVGQCPLWVESGRSEVPYRRWAMNVRFRWKADIRVGRPIPGIRTAGAN
jgi:hypothetical protein